MPSRSLSKSNRPTRNWAQVPNPSQADWTSGQLSYATVPLGLGNRDSGLYTRTTTGAVAARMSARTGRRTPVAPLRNCKIYISFLARATGAFLTTTTTMRVTGSTGTALIANIGPIFTLQPTWTLHKFAVQMAPAADAHPDWSVQLVHGAGQLGDSLEVGKLMISDHAHSGEYADGFMPGCVWEGAANLSTSIGYPYTLASLIGPNFTFGEGTNLQLHTGMGAFQRRSVLAVYDVSAIPTTASSTAFRIGSTSVSQGRTRLLTQAGSVTGVSSVIMANATDLPAVGGSIPNAYAPGRHVACIKADSTMRQFGWNADGKPFNAPGTPPIANTGFTDDRIWNYTADTVSGVALLAIPDDTAARALELEAWLSNKYNFAFAA